MCIWLEFDLNMHAQMKGHLWKEGKKVVPSTGNNVCHRQRCFLATRRIPTYYRDLILNPTNHIIFNILCVETILKYDNA